MFSMFERPIILASLNAFVLSAVAVAQAPQYTVHDLGTTTSATGTGLVSVTGINKSGQVVGCFYDPGSGVSHAFRSGPNTAPNPATDDLGTLGGISTCAYGINNLGQAVGGGKTATGELHGFRTAPNAKINPATDDIGTLGGTRTIAYGINDSGQVVGGSSLPSMTFFTHAFRTAANSPIIPADDITPPVPGLFNSWARSVNANGDAVGEFGTTTQEPDGAFVYRAGTSTAISCFAEYSGWNVTGINDHGQIAGNDICSTLALNVGVWQNGTISDLFQCRFCPPEGINNSLQFVGHVESHFPFYAYVYTGGAVYNLNDLIPSGSGWDLRDANGINDRGQIIGSGFLNGVGHVFRLDPVMSPSQAMSQMLSLVSSFNLDRGEANALNASINAALAYFNAGDIADAIGALTALENKVKAQTGKNLTVDQANQLIAGAKAAIQVM
jgi:probable HAF family extracellular repeat protein